MTEFWRGARIPVRMTSRPAAVDTASNAAAKELISTARALVEHGFAHLKNWRVLIKLRTNPARATNLLRALLILTNLEVNR